MRYTDLITLCPDGLPTNHNGGRKAPGAYYKCPAKCGDAEKCDRTMQFMNIAFAICRLYVIFIAAAGFLFGQLYFASFEWPATVAGIFGRRSFAVITLCIASLIGVTVDAYQYYAHQDISGNYYAWILVGPYSVCLLLIIWKVGSGRRYDMPIKMLFSRTSNGADHADAGIHDDSLVSRRTAALVGFLIVAIYNLWIAYRAGQPIG
jgi:hypothetical protein